MKIIKHILESKPSHLFSLSPQDSVFQALELMMEKNISAVLITDENTLVGIFTERDYARKIILVGKSSKETLLEEAMTKNPLTISSHETIDSCMSLMTNRHFRHLPVVENGVLLGMISIGDVVKNIIENQQDAISHLQSYITS